MPPRPNDGLRNGAARTPRRYIAETPRVPTERHGTEIIGHSTPIGTPRLRPVTPSQGREHSFLSSVSPYTATAIPPRQVGMNYVQGEVLAQALKKIDASSQESRRAWAISDKRWDILSPVSYPYTATAIPPRQAGLNYEQVTAVAQALKMIDALTQGIRRELGIADNRWDSLSPVSFPYTATAIPPNHAEMNDEQGSDVAQALKKIDALTQGLRRELGIADNRWDSLSPVSFPYTATATPPRQAGLNYVQGEVLAQALKKIDASSQESRRATFGKKFLIDSGTSSSPPPGDSSQRLRRVPPGRRCDQTPDPSASPTSCNHAKNVGCLAPLRLQRLFSWVLLHCTEWRHRVILPATLKSTRRNFEISQTNRHNTRDLSLLLS